MIFSDPCPALVRDDSSMLRKKILNLSYAQWEEMSYSKGTLHQQKRKASKEEPFKVWKSTGANGHYQVRLIDQQR